LIEKLATELTTEVGSELAQRFPAAAAQIKGSSLTVKAFLETLTLPVLQRPLQNAFVTSTNVSSSEFLLRILRILGLYFARFCGFCRFRGWNKEASFCSVSLISRRTDTLRYSEGFTEWSFQLRLWLRLSF
jgi:hypothetical protein